MQPLQAGPGGGAPVAAPRFAGLDTLRGFAVLRIILFHYTTRYHELYGQPLGYEVITQRDFALPMFFVISGFVVPMTLDRCRTVGEFVLLRASRLFPTFWLCTALTFIAVAVFGLPGRQVTLPQALVNLTMIPSTFGAPLVDAAYWTLSVELAFYALMVTLTALGQLHSAPLVALVLAAAHTVSLRLDRFAPLRDSPSLHYAHLFAIGLLLYEMRRQRRTWHWLAFAAVWVLAYLDRGPGQLAVIGVFFAATALSVFVDPKIFRIKPLLWLGAISYPLYLLHQNVGYVLLRALNGAGLNRYLAVALAFAAMVLLAWLVHRFVEQPCIDWAHARRKQQRARLAERAA